MLQKSEGIKITPVTGNSIINDLNSREIRTINSVKSQSNLGATTADLFDYLKPAFRKKTDKLIIHTGTNDHGEDINTIKKLKSLQ